MKKFKAQEWCELSSRSQKFLKKTKLDYYPELKFLGVRIRNCLNNAGIVTVADLLQTTEAQALKWRNFGKQCFLNLKNALKALDLKLSTKPVQRRHAKPKKIHVPAKGSLEPPTVPKLPPSKYDTQAVEPLIVSTATGKIYIYRVTSADGKTMKFFDSVTAAQACYSAMGSGHVDQIHIFPTAENIAYILNDHLELVGMKNKDRFDLWEKGKFGNGGLSNSMLQIPHYGGLK